MHSRFQDYAIYNVFNQKIIFFSHLNPNPMRETFERNAFKVTGVPEAASKLFVAISGITVHSHRLVVTKNLLVLLRLMVFAVVVGPVELLVESLNMIRHVAVE